MQGRAGQVVASPDGEWLLTLYVNTQSNTAFVHALNLCRQSAGLHRAAAVREVRRERPRAMDPEAPRRTGGRSSRPIRRLGRAVIDLPTGAV